MKFVVRSVELGARGSEVRFHGFTIECVRVQGSGFRELIFVFRVSCSGDGV